MKKIGILYTDYTPAIDALKYQLADFDVYCGTALDNVDDYDLVILSNYSGEFCGNALACHHSLLPAFDCDEPEKEAVLSGVKVTGVTFYYTNTGKIAAQYPIFIENDTHYDDIKQQLSYIEQILFPLVAESVVRNQPFEVKEFMNKRCGGGCGGCSSCSH